MSYLQIKTDEGVRKVPLRGEHMSIGRLTFNDISLASPQISRQHAELRRIDGAWWIADLNSTNGLHLHGKRIQDYRLADGDEISLSPSITVRFVEEGTVPASRTADPAPASAPEDVVAPRAQSPTLPPRQARLAGFTASDPDEQRKTRPVGQRAMQIYPPVSPAEQLVPVQPRSIYADDEVPYVPAGMVAPGMAPPPPPSFEPAPSRSSGPAPIPFSSGNDGPLGSFTADRSDPYRRSGALQEINGSGVGSAGNLLHVCQTCGQLTSPDSVYCQSCHHSIAHECVNCRLSLLPIQDRCPRCHTPNEFSVRRAHPGR